MEANQKHILSEEDRVLELMERGSLPDKAALDALRDDGILFSRLLRDAGIEVEFHDTHGTMHGFDYIGRATTTCIMEELRIEYMKRKFRQ